MPLIPAQEAKSTEREAKMPLIPALDPAPQGHQPLYSGTATEIALPDHKKEGSRRNVRKPSF